MLTTRTCNRVSDFRYIGRPCARLSGCVPGDETQLDRFSGMHNVPCFIQDVPAARIALKDVDENGKKALKHATNAFVLSQINAESKRVQNGAKVCKEDVCASALEKMSTQCAPLLKLEVVEPR